MAQAFRFFLTFCTISSITKLSAWYDMAFTKAQRKLRTTSKGVSTCTRTWTSALDRHLHTFPFMFHSGLGSLCTSTSNIDWSSRHRALSEDALPAPSSRSWMMSNLASYPSHFRSWERWCELVYAKYLWVTHASSGGSNHGLFLSLVAFRMVHKIRRLHIKPSLHQHQKPTRHLFYILRCWLVSKYFTRWIHSQRLISKAYTCI